MNIYIYIYIYRERERERESHNHVHSQKHKRKQTHKHTVITFKHVLRCHTHKYTHTRDVSFLRLYTPFSQMTVIPFIPPKNM